MEQAIEIEGIVKRFKSYESKSGISGMLSRRKGKVNVAVNGVSFSVRKGEIVALLGRNGSGKSTIIKMLVGVMHPDTGSVRVLGMDPWKDRIRLAQRIGVVFGSTHPQLFWDLPPIDTFNYVRDMYSIPRDEYGKRLERMLTALSLKEVYKRQTRQLSLGERMKCEFIAATLHAPEVVFMDEPTVGVDLPSRMAIAEAMLAMRKEKGTTFIVTTHVVDDVADVDRIILLDRGKLFFDGTQARMRRIFREFAVLDLYLSQKANPLRYARYGKVIKMTGEYVKLEVRPGVVRERWFSSILRDRNVIDYRLSEPGLGFMLNKMYKRMDSGKKGARRG